MGYIDKVKYSAAHYFTWLGKKDFYQVHSHRPYDDANYHYAHSEDGKNWQIILNKKLKDNITTDFEDFVAVAKKLGELDTTSKIEPRIVTDGLNSNRSDSLNEHRDDNLVWKIWLPKLGEYLNDGWDDIEFESEQDAWDYIYEEMWEDTSFDSSIEDEYYKQFEGAEPQCSNLDKYMTRKWDMNNESLEEAIEEKEFEATFHDGPNSDRKERVIIKAKDVDDAMEKAYRMPQAKRYSDVIVGERVSGLTAYMVVFHYNYVFQGKVDSKQGEDRLVFNAESEYQAKAAYNKKYLGKYFKWLYPGKDNILSEPPTDIQGGKYGRVFDVHQFGAKPSSEAEDAKEILNESKSKSFIEEKIEKQPNVNYKGFTIEHSPMGLVVDFTPDNLNKEHEMEIDGYFIHSPYYLQSNPNKEKIYLPLFCEDEDGHVINFETLDQAKKYIDDWMVTKKGRIKLKGWKKDECHFEILPEFKKAKDLEEGLSDLIDDLKKAINNKDKKAEMRIRKQLEKLGMDIATQNSLLK